MRLRVIEPASTLIDVDVEVVSAQGVHGAFTMLPHHIDFVAALVEGFLTYRLPAGASSSESAGPYESERYVAVDGGVLVKSGDDVVVSTPNAVESKHLEDLEQSVTGLFQASTGRDEDARAVLFRLETDVVLRMLELEERRGG